MYFNQTFDLHDLAKIAILVVLEAVLSIDNALVLGLLAKRLPVHQRAKALTLGLVGAFAFRFISIATAQWLLKYTIVKLLGGLYLMYVSLKYFWETYSKSGKEAAEAHGTDAADDVSAVHATQLDGTNVAGTQLPNPPPGSPLEQQSLGNTGGLAKPATAAVPGFWSTVMVIELTDIAFAVDSIVAAIGLVGPAPSEGWHPKLWVVVTGGMLGVVLMRYAATLFIRLLEMFPRFETAAYLLVAVIGGKLMLDWAVNTHDHHVLDFHSPKSPEFWIFWLLMLASFSIGFIPKKDQSPASATAPEAQ